MFVLRIASRRVAGSNPSYLKPPITRLSSPLSSLSSSEPKDKDMFSSKRRWCSDIHVSSFRAQKRSLKTLASLSNSKQDKDIFSTKKEGYCSFYTSQGLSRGMKTVTLSKSNPKQQDSNNYSTKKEGCLGFHTTSQSHCQQPTTTDASTAANTTTTATTAATRRTIFSGIQPTGELHLGNYLGAVKQWVELQDGGDDVLFCVVDLHSITLPQDPATLYTQTLTMAASLLACGIDPARATVFQQSRVAEHTQLAWVLGCLTTMPRLAHLPQYKEKSALQKEVPLGLYVYPVLQAADILLYSATHVPVGEDQRQHIQLASDLARIFNNKFGHTFKQPHSLVLGQHTARLRSLRQPTKKMSKSEADPRGRVALNDSPDVVREKFKKAVTDFTSEVYHDAEERPGVSNLMEIDRAVTGRSFDQIQSDNRGLTTAQYKLVVADAVIEHLTPIRLHMNQLLQDKGHLENVLHTGAQQAQERAARTWDAVRRKVGLIGTV